MAEEHDIRIIRKVKGGKSHFAELVEVDGVEYFYLQCCNQAPRRDEVAEELHGPNVKVDCLKCASHIISVIKKQVTFNSLFNIQCE